MNDSALVMKGKIIKKLSKRLYLLSKSVTSLVQNFLNNGVTFPITPHPKFPGVILIGLIVHENIKPDKNNALLLPLNDSSNSYSEIRKGGV